MASEVSYCTREQVQNEVGYLDTVAQNRRVDRAIKSASRDLEGFLHRRFYPETTTRGFNMPDGTNLWLYDNEMAVAPTSILSGGLTMSASDYFLQPLSGPPYRWLEINLSGSVYWNATTTTQRSIQITCSEWNYPTRASAATTSTTAMSDTTGTTVNIADSSQVGVGRLILIGSERLIVTEKTLVSTTATLTADLTASKSLTVIPVSSGALLNQGERILIDGEWMRIESIAGNNLVVQRAANGTVLGGHTSGALIYAPRVLRVERGALGSTAATHLTASTITNLLPPSLVQEATLAQAIVNLEQGSNAYARTVGEGENARESSGRGLKAIWEDAYTQYGRKTRSRAVGT